MALDPGEKRIGVAISDPLGITAQGLPTLPAQPQENFIASLQKLVNNYEVKKIVLGLPLNMDGSYGPKAQASILLQKILEQQLQIEVVLWDERLTTCQAERILLEADMSRKKRRKKIDQIAAVLILQSYLGSL